MLRNCFNGFKTSFSLILNFFKPLFFIPLVSVLHFLPRLLISRYVCDGDKRSLYGSEKRILSRRTRQECAKGNTRFVFFTRSYKSYCNYTTKICRRKKRLLIFLALVRFSSLQKYIEIGTS